MAFSRAGWEAAALRVKYSYASLALIRALARPRLSSKAALAALKFRTARRSKEANWEPAKPRRVSKPALFADAICSGVKYMIGFSRKNSVSSVVAVRPRVCGGAGQFGYCCIATITIGAVRYERSMDTRYSDAE